MSVPFLDLRRQYTAIRGEIERAVGEVLALPIYPDLMSEEQARVVEAMRESVWKR